MANTSGFFTATGGTMSNTADEDVGLSSTSNVSLSNMNLGPAFINVLVENSTGLSLASNTINNLPNLADEAVVIEGAFGTNNVSGNNISFGFGPGLYITGGTGSNFTINNNTFTSNSTTFADGLYLDGTVAGATNSYAISGNTFNMTTPTTGPGSAAISVFQDVSGTTNLSSSSVNVVHVTPPYSPFQSQTAGGGVINGQVNVNGTLLPP